MPTVKYIGESGSVMTRIGLAAEADQIKLPRGDAVEVPEAMAERLKDHPLFEVVMKRKPGRPKKGPE